MKGREAVFRDAFGEVRPALAKLRAELSRKPEGFPDAGLAGRQLELKLARVASSYDALQVISGCTGRRAKKRSLLGQFLEWADLVLGSVGIAVPPAEIIKEYKEVIELEVKAATEARERVVRVAVPVAIVVPLAIAAALAVRLM
jgi:hypothetical protein